MTVLEEIDGGGDSAQLMDQLMRLQERKAELNKNLEQIQDRNQELRQLVALKKTQIAVLQEDVKSSDERIAELRNSSTTLDKKAKVLEQEANSCRDSVQKMKQKLMDKKWQHFKDMYNNEDIIVKFYCSFIIIHFLLLETRRLQN